MHFPTSWVLLAPVNTGTQSNVRYLGGAPHGATAIMDTACTTSSGRVYGYAVPPGWSVTSQYVQGSCNVAALRFAQR
jgi:hypothetical protein